MDKIKEVFNTLREDVKKQVADAYKQGAREGAVLTCAILYSVISQTNLSKDHGLYLILNELAKNNGCEDLAARAATLRQEETPSASIDNE